MTALRIVHVIPNLSPGGGAQAVLHRMILADRHNEHAVVTLMERGRLGEALAERGVEVVALGMGGASTLPRTLLALRRTLRTLRPDVVQTWMYHADLIGGLGARLAGRPVVWGLHHTALKREGSSRSARLAARACARLSGRLPRRIVSCSEAGVATHVAMGYEPSRFTVVHNGYDTGAFTPEAPAGTRSLRAELGLPDDVRLLGMAARWHAEKDHENLLRALGKLRETSAEDWVCVLFGSNVGTENTELAARIAAHDLAARVLPLGIRADVADVMRSLDLHLLTSLGEAFSNVLNEAMLVGTPCVTTRVGDSALIVGETGWTVPPADPEAFADAVREALAAMKEPDSWGRRRAACRTRIVENFSVDRMVAAYDAVWREAAR